MKVALIALVSIAASVMAQFLLKAGMSSPAVRQALSEGGGGRGLMVIFFQPEILGGFFLYGAGGLVWLFVLSRWEVSKAYPLVGLGFLLTLGFGAVIGEAVGWARASGACLIALGVWLVARS